MARSFWVWLHRWTGLILAGFLIVVGLTGSLLAFLPELNRLVTPQIYARAQAGPPLDPATLAEQAETLVPAARVDSIYFSDPGYLSDPGVAELTLSPRMDPATGQPRALGFDQLLLDRSSGVELARHTYGAISEGWINLMPFIYTLHYELAAGPVGNRVLGIAALAWTIDSFVGFYLTLPAGRKRSPTSARPDAARRGGRSWWSRWGTAWRIKGSRLNFDLHRAGGLWLWAMLPIFAWSSVYMDLWDTVYASATRLVLEYHEPWIDVPKLDKPRPEPQLGWRQAQEVATTLMSQAAAENGFRVGEPVALRLDPERGIYVYQVRSSLDIQDHRGTTRICFDSETGALKLLLLPTGQHAGNTVTSWLAALHMANVFGLPYRVFVCLFGQAIVVLSVTGIVIRWRKRRARLHRLGRTRPDHAGPGPVPREAARARDDMSGDPRIGRSRT